MKWINVEEQQAHVIELQQEALHDRLVKEAHQAQKHSRIAGYFERIMSQRHEQRGDR